MGERSANWPEWRKQPERVERSKRTPMWIRVVVWAVLFAAFAWGARHLGLL
jgi:hypothetical protein